MHIVKSKHPAEQYAHDVLDGKVPSGRLLRLAVERDLYDHQTCAGRGLFFDREEAAKRIRFFNLCKQYDGEFEGQPLALMPWQQWVTWVTYGWKRGDCRRRFAERLIIVGSGNGKTTWMAGDALSQLVADGEAGAEVYAVAVQKEQALILWNAAARMVEQSPDLLRVLKLSDAINNHTIAYPDRNAKFLPLGRDSRHSSVEGKKPHAIYFDELHEYKDRKQVDVLKKKMLKRRQAMANFFTTASDDTPQTLYEEMFDYSVSVLEGFRGDFPDDSFLPVIFAIDDDDDPFADGTTDKQMLEMVSKANPNLGVSVNTSMLVDQWKKGQKIDAEKNSFLRYSCNRRASTAAREIPTEMWDACADPSIDWAEFADSPSICAVDLSSTTDLTSVTQIYLRDGLKYYRYFNWLPEDNLAEKCKTDMVPYDIWAERGWLELTPGNQIDDMVIARRIREIRDAGDVVQWCADMWHMKFIVNALQRLDEPIEVVSFLQDIKNYAEPAMHFLDEVRAGKMRHDGNPLARWCASNLCTREDSHGNRIPSKKVSKKRIDPIVAAIMARGRLIVIDLENPPNAGGSIWDLPEVM